MKKVFDQIPIFEEPEKLDVRYTVPEDSPFLEKWLKEPGVLRWFPMKTPKEQEDSIQRWIAFHKYRCSLTATLDEVPCGIATLWLQPYQKVSHQCQFGIIVDHYYRGKSVGSSLLKNLIHLAYNFFKIELLHLEVYEGNPAYNLYKRFGFKEFGRQSHWSKEDGEYLAKIFMERFL